jgi:hypothetical protein
MVSVAAHDDIARNREFLTFAASAGRFFAAVRTHRGHSRSSMVKPPRRNETNKQVAEKPWLQAAQKDPDTRRAKNR